jgi:hypothetical protein
MYSKGLHVGDDVCPFTPGLPDQNRVARTCLVQLDLCCLMNLELLCDADRSVGLDCWFSICGVLTYIVHYKNTNAEPTIGRAHTTGENGDWGETK